MLHLLEAASETAEQREARLREELAEDLRHAGSRPSWTSPLYIKLQKAGLLHLLPNRGSGPDTATLDSDLEGGVLQFVAGKKSSECLSYLADLEEKSLQRYSKDWRSTRRCFFADIVVAVIRGLEPATTFMEPDTAEEQANAATALDSLPLAAFDDTLTLRQTGAKFVHEEERWPDKEGGHVLDRELVIAIGKVRSRRFGAVLSKRQGAIHDYALPLREEQMLGWECMPVYACFIWWPHHLQIFEEVKLLWREEGTLPTRGPQSSSDALAQKLRRVRTKTVLTGRKAMRFAE